MNANELADDLESHLFAIGKERPFYEHATMLRQQQAEIEALKAKTLTDEEDTECQFCKQGCIRCDARKLLTDEEIKELSEKHLDMDWQTGVIEFARAILRKAQER